MMNLKRTVSLAVLAALLAANLASCANKKTGDDESGSGSESNIIFTPNDTNNNPGGISTPPTNDPSKLTYSLVDETVYLIQNATLDPMDANGQKVTLKADLTSADTLTALHRFGTATGWSQVDYQGARYYIKSSCLTKDNLKAEGFAACNKTKYVNVNKVNVRKFPSSNNDFSTQLGSRNLNDEVKVIAEGTGWSKIQWTDNGTTKYGFISSDCLSEQKISAEESEWLSKFQIYDAPVTMYVSTDQANIRLKPFTGKTTAGTLVEKDGLKKGTAVSVIGEGVIYDPDPDLKKDRKWYMVNYNYGGKPTKCYISADTLGMTPEGIAATLEDILSVYTTLQKFDSPKTMYVVDDTAHSKAYVYSAPSRETKNGSTDRTYNIDFFDPKTEVTVYAKGRIAGLSPDNKQETLTWALIKTEKHGFCFVTYSTLTTDPSGKIVQTTMTLDELCTEYGFTKITSVMNVKVTAANGISAWTTPDATTPRNIPNGETVKVLAQGVPDPILKTKWYIVEYDGSYWFIINNSDIEIV